MEEEKGPWTAARLLPRERGLILLALLATSALAWAYLYLSGESAGRMDAVAMASSPAASGVAALLLGFLMWAAMMAGMMLPSAAPMILTFAAISRRRRERALIFVPTAVFAAGYLLLWGAFSLFAAIVGWMLAPRIAASPLFGSLLMLAAAAYQMTPLKRVCLSRCRSPFDFLLTRWREGSAGALRMGVEHGLFCLGCCSFLMALLFAAGAMNLLWAAAIAAFVFVEKLLPQRLWTARAGGALLFAFALYLLSEALFA